MGNKPWGRTDIGRNRRICREAIPFLPSEVCPQTERKNKTLTNIFFFLSFLNLLFASSESECNLQNLFLPKLYTLSSRIL